MPTRVLQSSCAHVFRAFGGLNLVLLARCGVGATGFRHFLVWFWFLPDRILRFHVLGIQILDFKPDKLHCTKRCRTPMWNAQGICVPQKFRVRKPVCVLFAPVPLFCSGPLSPSFRPESRPISLHAGSLFTKQVVVRRISLFANCRPPFCFLEIGCIAESPPEK